MLLFRKLFGKKIRRGSVSQKTEELIKREWEQIDLLIKQKGPSQLRQALLKADKCLDNALQDAVSGNTMGERLKEAKTRFDYSTYDKIWKAHKVRNSLVHETGYEPPYFVVTEAIENLKKGLDHLGVRI